MLFIFTCRKTFIWSFPWEQDQWLVAWMMYSKISRLCDRPIMGSHLWAIMSIDVARWNKLFVGVIYCVIFMFTNIYSWYTYLMYGLNTYNNTTLSSIRLMLSKHSRQPHVRSFRRCLMITFRLLNIRHLSEMLLKLGLHSVKPSWSLQMCIMQSTTQSQSNTMT